MELDRLWTIFLVWDERSVYVVISFALWRPHESHRSFWCSGIDGLMLRNYTSRQSSNCQKSVSHADNLVTICSSEMQGISGGIKYTCKVGYKALFDPQNSRPTAEDGYELVKLLCLSFHRPSLPGLSSLYQIVCRGHYWLDASGGSMLRQFRASTPLRCRSYDFSALSGGKQCIFAVHLSHAVCNLIEVHYVA